MKTINQELADELVQMAKLDQSMRMKVINDGVEWDSSVDQASQQRMKEIIDKDGWPTIHLVGEEASRAAWLLVQHAPDLEFMEQCLALMKTYGPDEVKPNNVAFLEDRVLMLNGKPQVYGTQFEGRGDSMHVYEVADPEHLDKRRANMGLDSFAENEARIRKLYKTKN